MKPLILLTALLLSGPPAYGQIQVPAESECGTKIVATLQTPPQEGTQLQIAWRVSSDVQYEDAGGRLLIWAKPGQHSVDAVVQSVKTFVIKDVDGNEQTITSVVTPLQWYHSDFKVIGETPPVPPGPDPPPDPTDAPFPSPGFAAVFLYEASEAGQLPKEQLSILSNVEIRKYLRDKAVKEDGVPLARFWDDDYSDVDNAPPTLKRAYPWIKLDMAAKKGQLPWLAISTGKTGYSGPLPATVEETLTLLKKYGG